MDVLEKELKNIQKNEKTIKTEQTEKNKELHNDSQKNKDIIETNKNNDLESSNTQKPPKKHNTFLLLLSTLLCIILLSFLIFNLKYVYNNPNIIYGISIMNIDISNLSKENAKQKLTDYIEKNLPKEITLTHEDYETTISTEELATNFNITEAVNIAYQLDKNNNIFMQDYIILKNFFTPTNITPKFTINTEQLKNILEDTSNKLPDKVIDYSYYIDNENIIITKGQSGCKIDTTKTSTDIINLIKNLNNQNKIELTTTIIEPQKIDIEKIYSEIRKEPINASYTQNPYTIIPSENGLDFAITLDEARNILTEEKDEYSIPLKTLYPTITTNMIGDEAFPDLLSTFSTNYAASNINRTTNLILAANKINGTVLMPGETFSYNKTVGARTIAAGYKEAPIYVSGKVENGLGGGICQITTTLYNAALLANLEIIERSNHQFVPSYANASRDATVVYGAIDFKFKNNRNYPIKINCTVANGVANFKIWGIKTPDDYEVELSSRVTSTTANSIYSEAYKTLKKDGVVINSSILSKDIYKRH